MTHTGPKTGQLLKLLIGAAFCIWMVYSGKLDLHQVAESLAHWPTLSVMLALLYLQPVLTTWRWKLLLKAQEIRIPYSQAFGLTMIGLLFNLVVPGSVGGELMKGYYVVRATAGRKSPVATSILMDRVLGVLALFLLAVLVAAFNFRELAVRPATRSLGAFLVAGLLAGSGGLYAAVLAGARLSEWGYLPAVVRNAFRSLSQYHRKASVIPIGIAFSVLNHLLACIAYYLALRTVGKGLIVSPGYFFLLVPLGFLSAAIPLSPAGIGVGQAAFFALFQIISFSHATAAAAAFTVFQLVSIVISLSGLYFYLSYKHIPVRTGSSEGQVARAPQAPETGAGEC